MELAVVCPFCPLCCDDIRADQTAQVVHSDCPVACRQFEAALRMPPLRIGSRTLQSTDWTSARDSIVLPDQPVVEVNGATISEAKSIESLINETLIRIQFPDNEGSTAMDQTGARDGMMAATLGDVVRHADFLWVVGDIDAPTPRLRSRLRATNAAVESTAVLSLDLLAQIHQRIGRVNAEPVGNAATATTPGDRIFQQIHRSRYTAIVIGDGPFESGCEVIGSELLQRLMMRWNELAMPIGETQAAPVARAVMLRFGVNQSLRSVIRWRSNQCPSGDRSIAPQADIRIGGKGGGEGGNDADRVGLQIGGPDPGLAGAEAYIPAASPGVHFSDAIIRGDSSVTLPLVGWSESALPSRINVLRQLVGAE